jgi:dipeptidyl-peptidase-4
MHQFSLPSVTGSAGVAGAARECDPHITAEDYVRAEKFTADGVSGLVTSGGLVNFSGRGGISVDANWLSDDRFWYLDAAGKVVLVDPVAKTTATCDSAQCATLGISAGTRPNVPTAVPTQGPPLTLSPNGLMGAFVKDFNLWVRDIGTGLDRQLTFDGEQDFAYATDNAGWKKTDRAVLTWSPDSKKIATQQQDERQVGEWHLVKMTGGHPELLSWKYPLPTDSIVAMCHRVVIDVETATVVRLDMPPDYHRATLGDDISMSDYKWSPDGSQLVLVSTPRDHKAAVVRLADTATGAVRTVMEEHVETHFESVSGFEVRKLSPT